MTNLKKIFKPGTVWTRTNHRFPYRRDGKIVEPTGSPVQVKVVRLYPDAVAFQLDHETISYLSWPQPPLEVRASPDKVEISDNQGILLTYVKVPSLSEVNKVTLADFLSNGFLLMKLIPFWYAVHWRGERVGAVRIPSWSNPQRVVTWLNMANQKMPFDLSVGNFHNWMKRLEAEKVMPKFPILPRVLNKVAESVVDSMLENAVTKAAIRIKDGRIFSGPIHCMAVSVMQDQKVLSPAEEDLEGELRNLGAEFGWLDEEGQFLTRRQAYKLAVASGQIADTYGPDGALTHDMLDDTSIAIDVEDNAEGVSP
jgi:hypothetical protein